MKLISTGKKPEHLKETLKKRYYNSGSLLIDPKKSNFEDDLNFIDEYNDFYVNTLKENDMEMREIKLSLDRKYHDILEKYKKLLFGDIKIDKDIDIYTSLNYFLLVIKHKKIPIKKVIKKARTDPVFRHYLKRALSSWHDLDRFVDVMFIFNRKHDLSFLDRVFKLYSKNLDPRLYKYVFVFEDIRTFFLLDRFVRKVKDDFYVNFLGYVHLAKVIRANLKDEFSVRRLMEFLDKDPNWPVKLFKKFMKQDVKFKGKSVSEIAQKLLE